MAVESGTNVSLSYIVEVTHGTTPGAPAMSILRSVTRDINPTKNLLTPSELRSDRLAAQARHGFRSTAGTIGFELTRQDQDAWFEASLGGTWAAVTGTATATITTVQGSRTYTRAAGSFLTDGFEPGDTVSWAGLVQSASNGRKTIESVTATVMTVVETIGTSETSVASCSCTYTGKRLKVGTILRTFSVERRFTGITQFQVFTGVAINQLTLNITPENVVNGQYDVIGMNFNALSGTSLGTPSAATTNPAFNGFVGVLYENNLVLGLITNFTMTVNNNRNVQAVLFTAGSPDVFDGTAEVSGTISVMFQDAVMLNKFINETTSSIHLRMDDLNGTDFMAVRIPSLIYTGGSTNPPQSGPVVLDMPWRANPDATTATNLKIQRSNP